MGKKYLKTLKYKLCTFTYCRRAKSRCGQLSQFRKSFCEVYNILNPGADCRKQ